MAVMSTIEKFPLELKQALLSTLSDVCTLRSAALSCSSLYHAFLSAEELITTQVVKNQIDADVLPEAVVALKASRSQPFTRQGVADFVDNHLRFRMSLPDSWTLSEAFSLGNLHFSVERLASKFIAEMLNTSSEFAYVDAPPEWPASRQEVHRVQRAFYRFEIYCNLFREPDVFQAIETGDLFFSKFAYWENEQLGCVYDYLFQAVCPAFNDIVEHDRLSGELSIYLIGVVEYGDGFDSPVIQYLLSRGLVWLRQIVDADSYEARHQLLNTPYPGSHHAFLHEALVHEAWRSDEGFRTSEFTQEDEANLARDHAPFAPDPDNGPEDAWRWAHRKGDRYGFVYMDHQIALRARGYCMWDRARLDKWSLFQQDWEAPPYPHKGIQQDSRRAEMQLMLENRARGAFTSCRSICESDSAGNIVIG